MAVKRGQDMELWVNGVRSRVVEDLFGGYAISTDTLQALQISQGDAAFAGLMDEVRIHDRALSPAEICEACQDHGLARGVPCCVPQCIFDPAGCTADACSDGQDNDDDGLIDALDPGCKDASDQTLTPSCSGCWSWGPPPFARTARP